MKNPKVSIIMGIYNCEQTLGEAIESIVAQNFSDWELILCDDGSQDLTYKVARKYQQLYPQKIVLLQNKKNMGLNYTLNYCLKKAKGGFIARMDGDDVCVNTRLEKEVQFLEQHPEFAVVSSPMIMFDEKGEWGRTTVIEYPQVNDFCKHSPFFCHAASMIRYEAIKSVGGYTENSKFLRVEDCNLWFKLYARGYKGANLKEPLYMMRDDRNATHRRNFRARINGCYVMLDGFKLLHMPWYKYIYVIKNSVVELGKCIIPNKVYDYVHRKKYNR